MKNHLLYFVLMAGIIFTACQNPSPSITDSQKVIIEKQILEQWEKSGLAVKKSDADGYLTSFSSTGFVAMHSEGMQFISLKEYADSVKVWFSARTSNEIQQPTIKVTVLSDQLALMDQKSVFQLNLKDSRVVRCNHAVSFLFKKEDSGWKIIHGHESWTNL